MPKDWASIKEELEQLYVTEGQPLEKVRETLLSTRGFDASIRMYRIMLLRWGIKKYKSSNKCSNQRSRELRPAASVEPEDIDDLAKDSDLLLLLSDDPPSSMDWLTTEHPHQPSATNNAAHNINASSSLPTTSSFDDHASITKPHFGYVDTAGHGEIIPTNDSRGRAPEALIPPRPMRLTELLPLIRNSYPAEHAFEPLLCKWQSDGDYMACATAWLNNPVHCKNILGSSPGGGNHFKLIDQNVPFPERITLTKAFLKASIVHNVSPSQSIWSVIWGYTRYVDQWQTVKDNLLDASSGFLAEPGSVFHLCALAVMGEELLRGCKDRLESMRADTQPITVSKLNEAKTLRQQYVDILRDFRNQEVDVNISFYKYSLEILECNEALAMAERSRIDRLLGKYRMLVSKWTGMEPYRIDSGIDGLIEKADLSTRPATSSEWRAAAPSFLF